jgi:hypothetical protein
MPPRPIPKGASTVGQGMPQDVQMQAITYMMAMQAPHDDDPMADPAYAEGLAKRLAPVVASIDKGSPADKARLGRTETQAGGRRVDLLMASGCDAQLPMTAVVRRGGTSLTELLAHGVLVVRCNDAHWQCLQSTRDPEDVLCTTAPRHGK